MDDALDQIVFADDDAEAFFLLQMAGAAPCEYLRMPSCLCQVRMRIFAVQAGAAAWLSNTAMKQLTHLEAAS